MFCAASLCQDKSSESSPIMRDEVGEHMAWDPRPFLHTVSLQILQIQFLSFLTEAVRFSFNICWYLMESMVPCILTRCPGALEEKQPHNIKDQPPYFTVGMRCFSVWLSFCLRQTHLMFVARKLYFGLISPYNSAL